MIVDPASVMANFPKLPSETYGNPISSLTSKFGSATSQIPSITSGIASSLSSATSVVGSSLSSITSSVASSATHTHHHSATSVAPIPSVIPGNTPIYEQAGDAGQRTLWVVFVIMAIATAAFSAMSWNVPIGKRLYHIVTTIIVMTAAISYFAMAVGDGISYHHTTITEQHKHVPDTTQDIYRQVYWARYVDWSITTPMLLLDLALLAGMNGAYIFLAIVADLVMVLTGLFAAFGSESNPGKWGYYTIACIAYLVIIWHLAIHGRKQAAAKGGKVGTLFASIAGFTLILWTAYPIVWGIADGSRKASVDTEIISYAVLDVLAKPVFGMWLLLSHQSMPETNIDLGGFWSHGFDSEGNIRVGDDEEGA